MGRTWISESPQHFLRTHDTQMLVEAAGPHGPSRTQYTRFKSNSRESKGNSAQLAYDFATSGGTAGGCGAADSLRDVEDELRSELEV